MSRAVPMKRRLFLSGFIAAFLSGCANKFRTYNGPVVTRLRLYKAQRLLILDGSERVLRAFPIGLGFAPEGHKQFEGDGRTPEGSYVIDRRNPERTNLADTLLLVCPYYGIDSVGNIFGCTARCYCFDPGGFGAWVPILCHHQGDPKEI